MEDLNRDGLPRARRPLALIGTSPLFFVLRVLGGEHTILIVDGHIRDVMKVTSPAFRPRAAERSRRNRDLIPARPHDRLEGDRVAADSAPARRIFVRRWVVKQWVVEQWNGRPPGESILLSNSDTSEFVIPLIADRSQPIPIREVAAVPDDEGIGSIAGQYSSNGKNTVNQKRKFESYF
jgi:hypothetical protein